MRTLFFLSTGKMRVPAFVFSKSPISDIFRGLTLSATVAVVERANGDIVLVDVGWSEATCEDPSRELGALRKRTLGVVLRAGDSALSQLGARGISKDRVTHIVATHLHLDHIGGAVDFPNAEVVCGAAEYPAWKERSSSGYRPKDLSASGKIRPVDVSHPVDLFGDGSIVLVNAPGHTRGGLFVGINSHGARYVHVGDAAYQEWEYQKGSATLFARTLGDDPKKLPARFEEMRQMQNEGTIIVPSHDNAVFERLPK